MKTRLIFILFCQLLTLSVAFVELGGCNRQKSDGSDIVEVIRRYNTLLTEGYRTQNMNPLQEVTTREQAVKLYHHMAALGEGRLRLDSHLKKLTVTKTEQPEPGRALMETEEVWDFTHYRTDSGEKYAEERDFVYRMGYILQKKDGRWLITGVNTIGGTSTNCVIPLPIIDRHGNRVSPQATSSR